MVSKIESYANKDKTIRVERRNGILLMTLHCNGGALRWGFLPHGELPEASYDVGSAGLPGCPRLRETPG
jgi:hypothetical protein